MAAAAAAEEHDRSSTAAAATCKRSVREILGGGFVADVLLWRQRPVTISLAVSSTAFWIAFTFGGYNIVSLLANSLLLLVAIIFFWAKSATLLNRPLPPIPNLEISNEAVEKAAARFRVWINGVLSVARDISIGRNRKRFLQVILVLWVVSVVGSWCSFFTSVYIGIVLSLTVPVLYDNYQDLAREKLRAVRRAFVKQYHHAMSRRGRPAGKQKKIQ